ncbi:MAG: alginate lyase family protein [Halioglobus sp.]
MLRLLRTARHLKPIQITNRIARRFVRPRVWSGETPPFKACTRRWETVAALPASIIDSETACFLNEPGPLLEWQNPDKSHLWLYNLHYFDDLHAEHAAQRAALHRELIGHWLQANPASGGVGWEPYPTSLRIVNWVKWLLAGNEPVPGMLTSLFQQAHGLSQQLEYHLEGNHLLANAKALVFVGSCFEGGAAEGWLSKGLSLLDEQHREQLLPDGAHFELSPMYHSIILMDVLDIIQLGQCYRGGKLGEMAETLRGRAATMASWLKGMLQPDGEIPFFNDAAFGIAPRPQAILDYVHKLGVTRPVTNEPTQHYDASGYVAVRRYGQVALLDVAAIGPDYIPGHAHADTLSFEWSLHGQRVLVNSGISEYGVSEERLRQRGTAAHNTVVVNGEDSSEVWSGFRVARRAKPFGMQLRQEGDDIVVQASHDGYRRLRPKVDHHRAWRVAPGLLEINDRVEGRFRSAVAYYHLHPDVNAVLIGETVELLLPGGERCKLNVEGGYLAVEGGTWHPEFGLSIPNKHVAVSFQGANLCTTLRY